MIFSQEAQAEGESDPGRSDSFSLGASKTQQAVVDHGLTLFGWRRYSWLVITWGSCSCGWAEDEVADRCEEKATGVHTQVLWHISCLRRTCVLGFT